MLLLKSCSIHTSNIRNPVVGLFTFTPRTHFEEEPNGGLSFFFTPLLLLAVFRNVKKGLYEHIGHSCLPDEKEENLLLLHLHTPSQSIAGHAFEMHILVSVEEENKH